LIQFEAFKKKISIDSGFFAPVNIVYNFEVNKIINRSVVDF